jgi:hypothetical protein
MSGFRRSEDRGELVMPVDLTPGAQLPPEVCPAPPTLKGTLLEVDAPEWEAVLRVARHDFCHLPTYRALCAGQERDRPRALHATDGRRTMLLPLVIRAIRDGGFDATSPYGYPGPVRMGSEDPAFLRVELVAGLNVLREAGTVSVLVDERSHQGATCPTPALSWA